jgi:hypothetical protein
MKRVLLVGLDPGTVDFSDPALPPGMNAEKIHAGVRVALADMAERSWQAENCFTRRDRRARRRTALGRGPLRLCGDRRGRPPATEPARPVRSGGQRHPPRRAANGDRFQHPPRRYWRGGCALDLKRVPA